MEIVSNPTDFIPEDVLNAPPTAGRGDLHKGKNANQTYAVPFRYFLIYIIYRFAES
jgi:hypothetical protein